MQKSTHRRFAFVYFNYNSENKQTLLRKILFLLRIGISHTFSIRKGRVALYRLKSRGELTLIVIPDKTRDIAYAHFCSPREKFGCIIYTFRTDICAHGLTEQRLEAAAQISFGNVELYRQFRDRDLLLKMRFYVIVNSLYRFNNGMRKARQTLLIFTAADVNKAQQLQHFQNHIRAPLKTPLQMREKVVK